MAHKLSQNDFEHLENKNSKFRTAIVGKANIVPMYFYLLLKTFVRDGAKIFAWSRPNAEVHVHTVLGDSDVNCKQGAMISSILYLYLILDDRSTVCGSKNTSLSIHH